MKQPLSFWIPAALAALVAMGTIMGVGFAMMNQQEAGAYTVVNVRGCDYLVVPRGFRASGSFTHLGNCTNHQAQLATRRYYDHEFPIIHTNDLIPAITGPGLVPPFIQ